MSVWVRFSHTGSAGFGRLDGDTITVCTGDLFSDPQPDGRELHINDVKILTPTVPTKLIGMVLIFPLLGHATWRAYKELVE